MTSIAEQKQIAIDYVTHIASGGISEEHIADDFVAWSLSAGDMPKAIYWPRLKHVKAIFSSPLQMTIDMIVAVQDRVILEAHSRGDLYTGAVYSNNYMFVIEFNKKGQIRGAREYFNVEKLRATLMPALLKWEAENLK